MSSPAPVVIFAVGNPSRGDDALGPLLCARLSDWLDSAGLASGFELIEDFQLQIEHALDLPGRQLALFLDAAVGQEEAVVLRRIEARTGLAHSTHELPPESVLEVFRQTEGEMPPPAYVLGVRGTKFELGESLTPEAQKAAEAAFELLTALCRDPRQEAWNSAVR